MGDVSGLEVGPALTGPVVGTEAGLGVGATTGTGAGPEIGLGVGLDPGMGVGPAV